MRECFAHYIDDGAIWLKYAYGASLLKGREFHLCHELVYFMEGEAELISEHIKCTLLPDTLVVIPKEKYHCFHFTGDPDHYLRCIINFGDSDERGLKELIQETMNEIRVIFPVPLSIKECFTKISAVAAEKIPEYQKVIYLNAMKDVILVELSCLDKSFENTDSVLNPLTEQVVDYINRNFQKSLSVDDIAKHFNVSASTLYHIFKEDLRVSVYRYILNKRLITAQKLILEQTPVMQAAAEVGFNDYSGFYRAYKKYFGYAPGGMILRSGELVEIK